MRRWLIGLLIVTLASAPLYAQKKDKKGKADSIAVAQEEQTIADIQLQNQQAIKQAKQALQEIQQDVAQMAEQAGKAAEQTQQAGEAAQPQTEEKPADSGADVISPDAQEGFVAPREEVKEQAPVVLLERVVFNPKSQRDPTLSPDDFLLLQYREQQRLAAIEAERQRKLAEERRKREEAERLRQLELERIKDPTREVRNKIRVSGVIGQEVFIGSKIYTVGNTIFGARVVEVHPDYVIFSYKGHRFRRNVQL